jgi:outer membrane protein
MRSRLKRPVLSLSICLGLVFQAEMVLADVKLGYIDSEVLKEQMPELRQVRRQLEQLEQEYRREVSDRESKLLKYQEDFLKQELLMSEVRKAQLQKEFEQQVMGLDEFRKQKFGPEGELMKKNIQLSEPIFEKINAALKAIAEEDGYDFIFDVAGSGAIVYADERHDLTDKLLKRLKEESEEAGKRR